MVAYFFFFFFFIIFFLLFAVATASASSSSTSDSALLWGIWDLGKIFVHRHHYHQVGLPTFPSVSLSRSLSVSRRFEGPFIVLCIVCAPYLSFRISHCTESKYGISLFHLGIFSLFVVLLGPLCFPLLSSYVLNFCFIFVLFFFVFSSSIPRIKMPIWGSEFQFFFDISSSLLWTIRFLSFFWVCSFFLGSLLLGNF